jgi:transcriptional regulator with GAF, ATPase, and Fis domain
LFFRTYCLEVRDSEVTGNATVAVSLQVPAWQAAAPVTTESSHVSTAYSSDYSQHRLRRSVCIDVFIMLKLAVWRKWVTMVSLFVTLPVQLLLLLYFRVARHSSTIAQELHIDKMAKRRTAAEHEIKRQTTLAALKAKKFNVAAVARALGYTTRYIKRR